MARLLVQLKLRLVLNALRSSSQAKAGFIISAIAAVLVAAGTFRRAGRAAGQRRLGGPDHGHLHVVRVPLS